MNEFYAISIHSKDKDESFELRNLGKQRISMIVGNRNGGSTKFYQDVTEEDYDNEFVAKLIKVRPAYNIPQLIDFHWDCYTNQITDKKDKFLKHMKYVVLPILKKRYTNKEEYIELFEEWLENKGMKSKSNNGKVVNHITTGDINAPTQFQQDSPSSSQIQKLKINENDTREVLELIKRDIQFLSSEIKEEIDYEVEKAVQNLNVGKDIKPRLLIIGGLIKDVGINVFANLLASPIFEVIRPSLGI